MTMKPPQISMESETYEKGIYELIKSKANFEILDCILGKSFPIKFRYIECEKINIKLSTSLLEVHTILKEKMGSNSDAIIRSFIRNKDTWKEQISKSSSQKTVKIGDSKLVITIYEHVTYSYTILVLDFFVIKKNSPGILN